MDNKLKIVFFGTPEFSVKILETMDKAGYAPTLVITAPDKPRGRKLKMTPSPVKSWFMKHEARNIKILQPNTLKDLRIKIQELKIEPDLFIVASFGKILPKEILDIPKHGTLNVHPSLLPKLRGPSPIQSAILNDEKETGVTIMLMNEKMDEGPILTQKELRIMNHELRFTELENKLAELGGKLLVETIPKWLTGEIKPQEQNHPSTNSGLRNKATYSKLIKKSDGEIDWNESPKVIERKIRALNPWPSTYTFQNKKRIIITKAHLDKQGELIIERIKPEGKKELSIGKAQSKDLKQFLKLNLKQKSVHSP